VTKITFFQTILKGLKQIKFGGCGWAKSVSSRILGTNN